MRSVFPLFFLLLLFSACSNPISKLRYKAPQEISSPAPRLTQEEAFEVIDSNSDQVISAKEFAQHKIIVEKNKVIPKVETEQAFSIFLWILGAIAGIIIFLKIKPVIQGLGWFKKKVVEKSSEGLTIIKAKFDGLREERILPSEERVEDPDGGKKVD